MFVMQALVDRSVSCLYPFAITATDFAFCSVTSLVYKSLFQSNSVRHHAVNLSLGHGFQAMARQFTALQTLEVDCCSKAYSAGLEGLHLMTQLRRLKLNQFPFKAECFEGGIAACSGLQVLHLECQQVGICRETGCAVHIAVQDAASRAGDHIHHLCMAHSGRVAAVINQSVKVLFLLDNM
jgi:hypothetical protein